MQIIEAKLFDLKIDPANVRHTDLEPDESILASIRAKGVLQPLTVRKNDSGGFFVTDGGKRLAALHILARDGEFDKATPIKCSLRDADRAAAIDTSLTLNFIREDMHPVDIYEAFADLKECGKQTEDIAKEYGLPIPEVRQYLALGQLSPKVREAWKEGAFSSRGDFDDDEPEAIAQLFTLAGDHAQQDAMLEKLKKQKRLTVKWQVRDAIVGNSNEGGQLVAFIGVDAYRAAGGNLREDLFGSDHVIEDLPIARRLADEKIKAECERMIGLGWSWAEPHSTLPKGCEHSWQRAYESVEQFAKTKRKDWGLALYVGRDGELDEYILQKPEQKKAADKAAKTKAAKKTAANGEAAAEDAEPKISQALNYKLSEVLTKSASQAIILEPELAFCMGLAALLCDQGADYSDVKLQVRGYGHVDDEEKEWEFDKALAHAQKLAPKQRATMFAMFVGRAFQFCRHNGGPMEPDHGDARTVCEAIDPKAMNKALRDNFDAVDYFKSASAKIGGVAYAEIHGSKTSPPARKSELVEQVSIAARETGWLPPELRTKHYDGPGSKGWGGAKVQKPAAAAKPAKKAAKKAKR
ncbi:ParB N-terminal domain-containing protein [Bradyrhizobium sp. Pear76]|uniref:ParB/RepB/Spo0J family partition protein n=1 Tax=Bradyrhizobium oropedii TaxID=1571201 RepID=UPI001E65B6AC|nr:ParB/RepB/Spo0J family partition protein [Bradyrhizobium oropedii]MCC8967902.1 ParB N-terminal domain-containing protein [Bradyrhizobium oropedii]